VTMYQPSWRLGGKGASGRAVDYMGARRIEEHGLHVWFGFCENALTITRDDELARTGVPCGPFQTA
jgi:uncharacterized protein with NAD-binding domain and iron-sulfur cluster